MNILSTEYGGRSLVFPDNFPPEFRVRKEQIIKSLIQEFNGRDDCYISRGAFDEDWQPARLLVLFWDFDPPKDAEKLDEFYDEVNLFYKFLILKRYSSVYLWSSGRGFHVLMDSTAIEIDHARQIYRDLLSEFGRLRFFDQNASDPNPTRLMRVPGTINVRHGGVSQLIAAHEQRPSFPELDSKRVLQIRFDKIEGRSAGSLRSKTALPFYYCLEREVRRPNPTHLGRVYWTLSRRYIGQSIEDTFKEIRSFHWQDFEPEKTWYQLKHIYEGKEYPLSCALLSRRGFCCEDCPLRKRVT